MRKIVIAAVAILYFCVVTEVAAKDIALIVNQENTLEDISFHELVQIFKLDKLAWMNGTQIYLVMRESGTVEKQLVMEKILKMDEQQLKKYWLKKLYQGKITKYPSAAISNETVKRLINKIPGAIGYIDVEAVDSRVKVLRIDGELPGERGYLLSSASSY